MARAPVRAIVFASTSESISASMTARDISSRRASIVRVSVVVLPEPGLDIRLSRNVPCARRRSRSSSAWASLFANTLCLISSTRTASIHCPFSFVRHATSRARHGTHSVGSYVDTLSTIFKGKSSGASSHPLLAALMPGYQASRRATRGTLRNARLQPRGGRKREETPGSSRSNRAGTWGFLANRCSVGLELGVS